jgi:hypothetical protein
MQSEIANHHGIRSRIEGPCASRPAVADGVAGRAGMLVPRLIAAAGDQAGRRLG